MPERVAVHRIVVGGGGDDNKNRRVIEPGTRFNTEEYNIDAEQLEKYDRQRVTREPRDQTRDDGGPRANSRMGRVVEGRSGPVHDDTGLHPEAPGSAHAGPAPSPQTQPAQTQPGQANEREPAEGSVRRNRRTDHDL